MKHKTFWIGGSVLALVGMIWAASAITTAWKERDGLCRCNVPREVIGGFTRLSGGGMFASGVMTYNLWCKGTFERSGKACEMWYRVTEAEYDRRMYGQGKDDDE